jgi:SAM-dependent methyltransferase
MVMGGKNYTLSFYKNKLPFKEKQFNHIFQLENCFGDMIGDKKEVWIADLGAGMFSTTGSTWPDVKVHLYPSDFLANEYNRLLKDSNVTPLIPVEFQNMEELTYEDEFFDIIVCINALDHCEHPLKALQEMLRVLKKGGWVFIKCEKNNALNRKYAGLHQWNICKDGNDFTIWNKSEKYTLPGQVVEVENYVIIYLHK